MKTTYTFTVLRYVHDITTGEFVNVGVALYAPEVKYLGAICTPRYGRLSKVFLDIDGDHFRSLMRFIQGRFEQQSEKLRQSVLSFIDVPQSVMEIARSILPPDDSSLQWSEAGGGITDDPSTTLEGLYDRMVQRCEERAKLPSRDDEEIWRHYKRELEVRHVLAHLRPKRIAGKDYDYEFEHARDNNLWRLYEPMSFDLIHAEAIRDKANRWLGRAINLKESPERFKLYLLLGEPRDERLLSAFAKAKNILNKMPVDKDFVAEHEAADFSQELASEIAEHGEQ